MHMPQGPDQEEKPAPQTRHKQVSPASPRFLKDTKQGRTERSISYIKG